MATNMMDSLAKLGFFPANVTIANGTASGIPPGIMDTFLASAGHASPLLQVIIFLYRQLSVSLGLDPSLLLTTLGFFWGAQYFFNQTWHYVEDMVERHLMCSISVNQNDDIYDHLMQWLSKQPKLNNSRYLMAQTMWRSAWEEDEEDGNGVGTRLYVAGAEKGEYGKYLNFSNQAARYIPRYVPAMGTSGFWHNRRYFKIYRRKESLVNSSGWGAMKDQEELKISSYGRSVAPIKQLLFEAKMLYYHNTHQRTTIFRPRQKEQRREYNLWQQVAYRPVRPMDTVVLDDKEKHEVLADINEYLHPSTPKWYAARGIPLRRGYLFHGPPGTGKTSFSFALAGVFGINIYVISLQDASVTEEDLGILFTKLPRRCVVLLEDIDTAGLRRDDEEVTEVVEDADKDKNKEAKEDKKDEKAITNGDTAVTTNGDDKKSKKKSKKYDSDSSSDSSSSDSDSGKKSKRSSKKKKKVVKSKRSRNGKLLTPESISLSGLLNAIDGVASHEGRVLILTTNKPESLDEALVRPGRVDRQVAFANATSVQAGELFHRMYELRGGGSQAQKPVKAAAALNGYRKNLKDAKGAEDEEQPEEMVTAEELKGIAQEFGRMVPEGMFSPAEIQGFLLKRKKSPRRALADAREWIDATVKQKEAKSKVLTVQ